MIKGRDISKTFDGFKALDNLNINIEKGAVYGLVGPNGAGKTTLIKLLTGVYKADTGTFEVDGRQDFLSEDIKQKTVYISDDLYFYPTFTVKQMASFYRDVYKSWDGEAFKNLASLFGIDIKRKASKLSKGMKKQAAFLLALSAKPDLLVLDEPIDGLDPVMRRNIMSVVLQEVESRDMTVLISSHNLRELEDICDHVGIMHEGKIVIEKSLDDVKGNIHKLQLAFEGDAPADLKDKLEILKEERFGSVCLYIVRGNYDDIKDTLAPYKPLICDILPLSLEEVFIYELGGMGYELKNELI